MSTHDVPGANPANGDVLAAGSWAEHVDGSLIFVEGNEGGRVIYSMFDMAKDPPIEYRDAMPEVSFKDSFSWKPKDKKSIKWTWHDKTPFNWDRIIKKGITDGPRLPSAGHVLTAAEQIAESLALRARALDPRQIAHRVDQEVPAGRVNSILDKIERAMRELGR